MLRSKLKDERIKRGLKQSDMITLLRLKTLSAYSQKETGKRSFTQNEIMLISKRFNLSGEEIKDIFFN